MARETAVLIVDDEPPIRRFLKTSLSAQGYRVVEADSGAAALKQLTEDKPDLVVLDLGLPDMNGLEVIRAIRKISDRADRRAVGQGRRAEQGRGARSRRR